MKQQVRLPFIAWRNGRPRFAPGPRERDLGFKGQDLCHPDGRWFTLEEAMNFSATKLGEIEQARGTPPRPRKAMPQRANGYVYFLRSGDRIKIGFSLNPFDRAGGMKTALADGVTCLVAVPGTQYEERRLHRALYRHRRNGEWFERHPDVVQVMIRSATFGIALLNDEDPSGSDLRLRHETFFRKRTNRNSN